MYIIYTLDLESYSHSHRWQDHEQGHRLDCFTIPTLPHCTSLYTHYMQNTSAVGSEEPVEGRRLQCYTLKVFYSTQTGTAKVSHP